MKPIKRTGTREYVCESERELPQEEQTIFVFTQPTIAEKSVFDDHLEVGEDMKIYMNIGTKNLLAWNLYVKEVKNFDGEMKRDAKKSTIGNTGKRPWTMESLNQFDDTTFSEVAAAATKEMTEEEEKN